MQQSVCVPDKATVTPGVPLFEHVAFITLTALTWKYAPAARHWPSTVTGSPPDRQLLEEKLDALTSHVAPAEHAHELASHASVAPVPTTLRFPRPGGQATSPS